MARWVQISAIAILAVTLALAIGGSGATGVTFSPPSPISPQPTPTPSPTSVSSPTPTVSPTPTASPTPAQAMFYLPVVSAGAQVRPMYLPLVLR